MVCLYNFVFLWLLQRILNVRAQTILNVSEKENSWSGAIRQCRVATPDLYFKDGELMADIELETEEDVWLGYIRQLTVFQYIGCQSKPTAIKQEIEIERNSPGNCTSACGSSQVVEIGLRDNKCYCFDATTMQHGTEDCDKECEGQNGVACGGSEGQISLYKILQDNSVLPSSPKTGNCVQVGRAGRNVNKQWISCPTPVQALCSKNAETVVLATKGIRNYTSWHLAANRCFNENLLPADLQNVNSYTNSDQAWIGLMRSPVIYNYYRNEETLQKGTEKEYIYLSAKKRVNFATSGRKKYLCTNVPGETSTDNLRTAEPGTDVGVAVGVPVTLLVIAVIVVIVIIFLKKRNIICANRPKKAESSFGLEVQEQSEYSVISDSALTKTGPAHFDGLSKNRTYSASNDLDPGHYAHTYFVLDKEGDENDAYNVTGDHNLATNHGSDKNIYSKLGDKSNSTYDRVQKPEPVTALSDFKGENNYDSKGTTIKTMDSSTACESKDYKNVSKVEEDDTYNHTCVKAAKPTDNVYGVPDI